MAQIMLEVVFRFDKDTYLTVFEALQGDEYCRLRGRHTIKVPTAP